MLGIIRYPAVLALIEESFTIPVMDSNPLKYEHKIVNIVPHRFFWISANNLSLTVS